MKQIVEFLRNLEQNNNRVWFNAHKDEYLECKARFDRFVTELIEAIRAFDPSIGPLSLADCTYRIYRDTRFSKNKAPYKTHFGTFISPGGKKSPFAGYYVQIGPADEGFESGCILAAGDYCCDPKVLRILREDIEADKGETFDEAVRHARGFAIDTDMSLKRCPRDFPADQPFSHWFLLKNFCLVSQVGLKYMLRPALVKRIADDLRTTKPFLDLVNRAIQYSIEED